MDNFDYWRLCDELSVVQAACLIVGVDPYDYRDMMTDGAPSPPKVSNSNPLPKPSYPRKKFEAVFIALKNAIKGDRLSAAVTNYDLDGSEPYDNQDLTDWDDTTIMVEDLRKWLESKNITTGFFFPETQPGPPYLDPKNKFYAPKLAAAVRAWQAVTSESRYLDNGRSPKQNLEKWLTVNAKDFGLVNDNDAINKDAIKNQIAKVANWQEKGGAPKTPESK
jgi:hypothetical protein